MKKSTKAYLFYGLAAYGVYYWYKNYGPGAPANMGTQTTAITSWQQTFNALTPGQQNLVNAISTGQNIPLGPALSVAQATPGWAGMA